jgi:putative effector of murein hydrolase LrgA (UPF0299 family)
MLTIILPYITCTLLAMLITGTITRHLTNQKFEKEL